VVCVCVFGMRVVVCMHVFASEKRSSCALACAVCCGVLQCVAVCCSVLRCFVVRCGVL